MQFSVHPKLLFWAIVAAGLLASASVRAQEPRLERTAVLGGKMSLLLPVDFKPMSEEVLNRKYPNAGRPTVVYTNAATTINVALDHTAHPLPAEAVEEAHKQISAGMKGAYPSAEWFRSEIKTLAGRPFFLMELRTPAIDTQVRNIIVGSSLDDRLLMISFNVTRELEAEWLGVGNKIIDSIVIN